MNFSFKNLKIYIYLIVTVALVAMLCIGSYNYLSSNAEKILDNYDLFAMTIKNEKWEEAQKIVNTKYDFWNQQKNIWQMLIDHDEIDDIEFSFLSLKGYVESEVSGEALKELYLLKYKLTHVIETEMISLENLL